MEEERIYCHVCGKDITDNDNAWECDICGEAICADCESEIVFGNDHICKKCAKTCVTCGKEYESEDEMYICEVCGARVCGHCVYEPVWGVTLCEKCNDRLQEAFASYELDDMSPKEAKNFLRG